MNLSHYFLSLAIFCGPLPAIMPYQYSRQIPEFSQLFSRCRQTNQPTIQQTNSQNGGYAYCIRAGFPCFLLPSQVFSVQMKLLC